MTKSNQITQALVNLRENAQAIAVATPGKDILVLERGDSMYGYRETPLESEFCNNVLKLNETLTELLEKPEPFDVLLIHALVEILILVRPAVHAYRERMFKYATDYGSETSPISYCQRKLVVLLRQMSLILNDEERNQLRATINQKIGRTTIESHSWLEWDRHSEHYETIFEILGL